MNHTVVTAIAALLSTVPVFAQPGMLYRGHLDPEALPTMMMGGTRLARLDTEKRPTLPGSFRPASAFYEGEIEWPAAGRDGKVKVFVSQSKSGGRFACADLNGDGNYAASECQFFALGQQENSADPEVRFFVPTRVGPFKRLPLVITCPQPVADRESNGDHIEIRYTGAVYARGSVDIAGQKTLVTFTVSLGHGGQIDPRNCQVGVDGNGNGKLDGDSASIESSSAENEDLVFKVGQRYVSVRSIDPATGDVLVEERSASDYIYIDRVIGAPLPDFGFTDFDGKPRRLSDFRGKFVLLDFWGTWCGPCIREFPFLKAAYETLHERGLEIIGIDYEYGDETAAAFAASLDKAKELVAARGITWPQATAESTKNLTERRFRVQEFPTALLLAPDGELLSTGSGHALRGDNLLPTLESLMFKKQRLPRQAVLLMVAWP